MLKITGRPQLCASSQVLRKDAPVKSPKTLRYIQTNKPFQTFCRITGFLMQQFATYTSDGGSLESQKQVKTETTIQNLFPIGSEIYSIKIQQLMHISCRYLEPLKNSLRFQANAYRHPCNLRLNLSKHRVRNS